MATNDDPPPIISITLQIMSQTSNFLFCPMTEWLLGVTSNNARWPKQSKADMTTKGPLHLTCNRRSEFFAVLSPPHSCICSMCEFNMNLNMLQNFLYFVVCHLPKYPKSHICILIMSSPPTWTFQTYLFTIYFFLLIP